MSKTNRKSKTEFKPTLEADVTVPCVDEPEPSTPKPKKIVKKSRKPNAWIEHVRKVKADNPDMNNYREIFKLAKQSYKK